MGYAVYGLAQAQAVAVVGIGIGLAVDGSGGKPSALSPSKGIAVAVVVAEGVAGSVIGNGLTVKGGKQVSPVGVLLLLRIGRCILGFGKHKQNTIHHNCNLS